MKRTQNRRRCFVLLAGFCIAGLLLAGCDEGTGMPTPGSESPGAGASVKEYAKDATCVVCSDKLGSKGDPLVFMNEALPFMVCSEACGADFKKDPAKYAAPKPPAATTE